MRRDTKRPRAAGRAMACAAVFLGICAADPRTAEAQRVRRRFEPTDLDLTPRGIAEIDVQGGWLSGEDGDRIIAPDVEASLGIGSHAELEIDTTCRVNRGASFVRESCSAI